MSYQYETSLPAYKSILPSLNDKQRQVLECIQMFSVQGKIVNDRMISEHMGWAINGITNRRGELVKKGYIYEYCKQKDPVTGNTSSFWKVANKQIQLF